MLSTLTGSRVTTAVPQSKADTLFPKGSCGLRPAIFNDYEQIASLQARNGLRPRLKQEWMSLWRGNPIYEELREKSPIGWVLENSGRDVVGFIGNIPLACHFGGRRLRTAAACDWGVDAEYRGSSMLLLDRFMDQNETDLFLTTTASTNSEPALKIFDWSKAPVKAFDKSAFWITNYRGFAKSVFKSIPIFKLAGHPLSLLASCLDIFSPSKLGLNGADLGMESCSAFDSRFDEFWEELTQQNDNILLPYRTRETLEWHFRASLKRQELTIVTKSNRSRLVAYAIFDRKDNPNRHLRRVRLVDFQALKGFENVLGRIICSMLRTCYQARIHMLENVGAWFALIKASKLPKPYYRTLPAALYYYHAPHKSLAKALANPSVWAPTTFDGDASL